VKPTDPPGPQRDKLLAGEANLEALEAELSRIEQALPDRINADPERVEQGLARLVLALIDLLRQLLERQALRRVEAGSLTDEEVERLGLTFMRLDARMKELTRAFGLEEEDLRLDLGSRHDVK
jgi:hypothetical protein